MIFMVKTTGIIVFMYEKTKEILDSTTVIKSQRQPKNIKKILTSFSVGERTTYRIRKIQE